MHNGYNSNSYLLQCMHGKVNNDKNKINMFTQPPKINKFDDHMFLNEMSNSAIL